MDMRLKKEQHLKTFLSMCESYFDNSETQPKEIDDMLFLMNEIAIEFENDTIKEAHDTFLNEWKWYKQDKPIF